MDKRIIHNIVWSSSFLIGFSSFLLGLIWLSHPEPWILDRVPNEEILGLSFKELFTSDINKSLPDYLRVVYRFFAWWIISSSLVIMAYVKITRMGTPEARNMFFGILGIILIGIYYLLLTLIPSSPFLVILHGVMFLWIIGTYAAFQLD